MANNYLFDSDSIFLNGMFLGKDIGNQAISPELRQIIATNQTRDAIRDMGKLQTASLYCQHESLTYQEKMNDQLGVLNAEIEGVGSHLDQLSSGVQEGFAEMGFQIENLTEGVHTGFRQVGLKLQTGFQSVIKGLYHIDDRLGQRIVEGFSTLATQQHNQHNQLTGILLNGFNFLADTINQSGHHTLKAIEQSNRSQINAIRQSTEIQAAVTANSTKQIVQAIEEVGIHQTEAIIAMHKQLAEQMAEIGHLLRSPNAVSSLEHFLVGMNYIQNTDIRRAHKQFKQALSVYSGHFPTLFAYGFCCRILGDIEAAKDAFEASISQCGNNENQNKRQYSLSALYLGRIAFDQHNYNEARQWFHKSYRKDEFQLSALSEGAASLLLDPIRIDKKMDALKIKKEFNKFNTTSYILWYMLSLILAASEPDIAKNAFKHGAAGDYRMQNKDRIGLISLLWELNPRCADILIELIKNDFPWL